MPRTKKKAVSADQELSSSQLPFLLANIAGSGKVSFKKGKWADLRNVGTTIKQVILDQNIDLESPEVSVGIYIAKFGKNTAALVDVESPGGDAPEPFRFIYLAVNGKYQGYAGEVAS